MGRTLGFAALLALALGAVAPVAATGSVEERGDVQVCRRAEQPGVRFQCVSLYAEQARDPALCQRIPAEDSAPEGVFQETCRAHLAVTLKRPELCRDLKTPNLADACYLQMVEAGADPALCQRIENEIIKSACGPGD